MITLDPKHAALVLIDLQNGILAMPTAPRLGPEILQGSKALAARFRAAGAPVVLVRVAFAADYADAPPSLVDQPMKLPPGGMPEAWSALAEGLASPGDILVVKRQWGAFTGTDLDLQLRRRGVKDVVIGGIATNIGVESTVRNAWELGYNMVVAEDLCATHSTELHEVSIRHIFPRIARVTASDSIAFS
jgi:nicotinamidase-related amidase